MGKFNLWLLLSQAFFNKSYHLVFIKKHSWLAGVRRPPFYSFFRAIGFILRFQL